MAGRRTTWRPGRGVILAVAAYVALGALAACSDGGSPGPIPPPPALDLPGWAAAYATSRCAGRGECCAAEGWAFDEAKCRTAVAAAVENDASSLEDVVFDGAAAAACAAILEPSEKTCGLAGIDECGAVLQGLRATGATCTSSSQCAGQPDSICTRSVDSDEPRCEPLSRPVRASRGQPCTSTCNGDGCSGGYSRPPSSYCDAARDGLRCAPGGTCEPLVENGGPCSFEDDRGERRSCIAGTYCDGRNCVAQLGEGTNCLTCERGSCLPDHSACRAPLACVDAARTGEYRCADPLPLGAGCDPAAVGRDCASGSCNRVCTSINCGAGGRYLCVPRVSAEECDYGVESATAPPHP